MEADNVDERRLRQLLEDFRIGKREMEEVVRELQRLPYSDLGFAKLDRHRAVRKGFPEVIYCAGKSVEQVCEIFEQLAGENDRVLATRATRGMAEAVQRKVPRVVYHESCGVITLGWRKTPDDVEGDVAVVSAGTSDIPVAEEGAVTAEIMGSRVARVYDVGVAGLHRLLGELDRVQNARAVVVVAGMEGALASVVGGLVDKPVVAVPTSVGYGAAFGGIAALLSMLNSCAPGVAVVNIDNGFGGGYMAHLIARRSGEGKR